MKKCKVVMLPANKDTALPETETGTSWKILFNEFLRDNIEEIYQKGPSFDCFRVWVQKNYYPPTKIESK